ncbi:gp3 [Caviid betaherpesvirus 2]|uniref:Gp3 n=1 Tax=Guinea pig cytomegalovirus (strain 22122) TaxID=103920 RepID=B7TPT4_GPCMV|nr:gp3 [Caviid betaherpesvirus 2]AGE11496.1 gp3 [Caviid betaherpesvirus 2]AIL83884.1 gp3 [BAC cloning vector GPN13BACdenovo_preserved(MM)]BAJ78486.1 gp3 [Caviid betaherpesvirus 2]
MKRSEAGAEARRELRPRAIRERRPEVDGRPEDEERIRRSVARPTGGPGCGRDGHESASASSRADSSDQRRSVRSGGRAPVMAGSKRRLSSQAVSRLASRTRQLAIDGENGASGSGDGADNDMDVERREDGACGGSSAGKKARKNVAHRHEPYSTRANVSRTAAACEAEATGGWMYELAALAGCASFRQNSPSHEYPSWLLQTFEQEARMYRTMGCEALQRRRQLLPQVDAESIPSDQLGTISMLFAASREPGRLCAVLESLSGCLIRMRRPDHWYMEVCSRDPHFQKFDHLAYGLEEDMKPTMIGRLVIRLGTVTFDETSVVVMVGESAQVYAYDWKERAVYLLADDLRSLTTDGLVALGSVYNHRLTPNAFDGIHDATTSYYYGLTQSGEGTILERVQKVGEEFFQRSEIVVVSTPGFPNKLMIPVGHWGNLKSFFPFNRADDYTLVALHRYVHLMMQGPFVVVGVEVQLDDRHEPRAKHLVLIDASAAVYAMRVYGGDFLRLADSVTAFFRCGFLKMLDPGTRFDLGNRGAARLEAVPRSHRSWRSVCANRSRELTPFCQSFDYAANLRKLQLSKLTDQADPVSVCTVPCGKIPEMDETVQVGHAIIRNVDCHREPLFADECPKLVFDRNARVVLSTMPLAEARRYYNVKLRRADDDGGDDDGGDDGDDRRVSGAAAAASAREEHEYMEDSQELLEEESEREDDGSVGTAEEIGDGEDDECEDDDEESAGPRVEYVLYDQSHEMATSGTKGCIDAESLEYLRLMFFSRVIRSRRALKVPTFELDLD